MHSSKQSSGKGFIDVNRLKAIDYSANATVRADGTVQISSHDGSQGQRGSGRLKTLADIVVLPYSQTAWRNAVDSLEKAELTIEDILGKDFFDNNAAISSRYESMRNVKITKVKQPVNSGSSEGKIDFGRNLLEDRKDSDEERELDPYARELCRTFKNPVRPPIMDGKPGLIEKFDLKTATKEQKETLEVSMRHKVIGERVFKWRDYDGVASSGIVPRFVEDLEGEKRARANDPYSLHNDRNKEYVKEYSAMTSTEKEEFDNMMKKWKKGGSFF